MAKGMAGALEKRANEIHGSLPVFTQSKTTTAVGSLKNSDGSIEYLVGSSEKRLRPAQRNLLNPNEVEATGIGHAEETIINQAKANGQTVEEIAASRPICKACKKLLNDNDIKAGSPFKK
ncbi:hypothetical protein H1230_12625 [Paenibacillus sp. 19GGS1-52]|uniref:hypothetical protein n=1 Tax=Paenibacillus sp. 19GGS1-52 TaxID=2758563 RepID=UPI001EFA6B53|nr:hypothetical protein [Paenibacillus sp. 19GGS1-52]ULO09535.1 hypothetical protein H1230_12625 [Paenibacillus sp. 19GGS1-52]